MNIDTYQESDCNEIVNLFYDTVQSVNSKDYTQAQLDAWAPRVPNAERWNESLSDHYTIVYRQHGTILGFGDISKNGYLDRLFVHKNYQNVGIATAILSALEEYARAIGCTRITTHASITAQPFFDHHAYTVLAEQQVHRNHQILTNYSMEKVLI